MIVEGRFNWPDLMKIGLHQLGLRPDEFWALTPVELLLMVGAVKPAQQMLTRQGLDALCALYPDTQNRRSAGGHGN